MKERIAQAAAKHSPEAYTLRHAEKALQRAAGDLKLVGENGYAETAARLARQVAAKRRRLMATEAE